MLQQLKALKPGLEGPRGAAVSAKMPFMEAALPVLRTLV